MIVILVECRTNAIYLPGEQLINEIRMSGLDAVFDGVFDEAQQMAVGSGRPVELEIESGMQLFRVLPVEHGTPAICAPEHGLLEHQTHRVPDERLVFGRVRSASVIAHRRRQIAVAGRLAILELVPVRVLFV